MVRRVSRRNYRSKRVSSRGSRSLRKRVRSRSLRKKVRSRSLRSRRSLRGGAAKAKAHAGTFSKEQLIWQKTPKGVWIHALFKRGDKVTMKNDVADTPLKKDDVVTIWSVTQFDVLKRKPGNSGDYLQTYYVIQNYSDGEGIYTVDQEDLERGLLYGTSRFTFIIDGTICSCKVIEDDEMTNGTQIVLKPIITLPNNSISEPFDITDWGSWSPDGATYIIDAEIPTQILRDYLSEKKKPLSDEWEDLKLRPRRSGWPGNT